jgi:ribosomal protein S18 acetylase RimI-like enzyme
MLVATIDNQFAGYSAGQLTTRFACDGELQLLNVAEPFRGQGVANALIKELLS